MLKNNSFYFEKLDTIVFLGYSPILEKLIEVNENHKIKSIVISSTDQSKKISKNINFNIFDEIDDKLKKFINENTDSPKTLFFSIGSRNIFKKDIIENLFSNNLVNTHATRLPLGRGEVTSWRILKEDRLDNQLIHIVEDKIDKGPIILNKLSVIPKKYQLPSEIEKFRNENFLRIYESLINKLINQEKLSLKHQTDYLSSYLPRLSTEDNGWIDWSLNPHELIRFINAFDDPYKGASSLINRKNLGRLHLKSAQLHGGEIVNHNFMSGIVTRHDNEWIIIALNSKYSLIVEKIFNESGENIIKKIKEGDRFYTSLEYLENAKKFRAFFDSKGIKKD